MKTKNEERKQALPDSSLNLELFIGSQILRLNSLHYGYWDEPEATRAERLNLESLRRAQTRYTETLLDLIPGGVTTILDVGCGMGDVDRMLADKGYRVTAISPDRHHRQFFNGYRSDVLQFHNLAFEAFSCGEEKYDLILMSESQTYIDAELTFSKSKCYLRPRGYLLISGIFRKSDSEEFAENYVVDTYIDLAETYGLCLVESIDISRNVLPNLIWASQVYHRYYTPTVAVLDRFLGNGAQVKLKLLLWLFGGEFKRLDQIRRYYEERVNPELFRRLMCYKRLLFQAPDSEFFSFSG